MRFYINIYTYKQDKWNTCSDVLILTFTYACTYIQEHVDEEAN